MFLNVVEGDNKWAVSRRQQNIEVSMADPFGRQRKHTGDTDSGTCVIDAKKALK